MNQNKSNKMRAYKKNDEVFKQALSEDNRMI